MSDPMQFRDEWTDDPFLAIAALADATGAGPLNRHPGLWDATIDAAWRVIVNGHAEPLPSAFGSDVDPYTAHVYFNGWPAAVLRPMSDGVFAAGSGANPETFAAAVDAAIRRLAATGQQELVL